MQLFRKIQLQSQAFMSKSGKQMLAMEAKLQEMEERLKVMESKLPANSLAHKKKKGIK